jgi:site-specific DNA recombinase
MPELGGEVDPALDNVEVLLTLLGIIAQREVVRARNRSTNAMTAQVRDQGRYEGGRAPYGYLLVDAGPHPNRAEARRGGRLYRFDADPTPCRPCGGCSPPAWPGSAWPGLPAR